MTNQHSLTPPLELVQQWWLEANYNEPIFQQVAAVAAQWGADQELEACVEWVQSCAKCGYLLRATRRSKPLSLKQQALAALEDDDIDVYLIRRALEALPND